jgi:hypothetical protein
VTLGRVDAPADVLSFPRPVIYATSAGQVGLTAPDLPASLELIVGLPSWPDC